MERRIGWLVVAGAAVLALVSARDYAGCWNDGSRLATVEALVDRDTFVIDHTSFVEVPRDRAPYPPSEPALRETGTLDKLWINGHYYSDKPPVPALLLAALYQLLQWTTGLTARGRPDLFCRVLTLASAGLPYVAAVGSVYGLGRPLRLGLRLRLLLTASFALATVALPYARHVNQHILLLGVAGPLVLGLAWLAEESRIGRPGLARLLGLGTLAGFGYTIDLGAGPVLLVCTAGVVVFRCRRFAAVAAFLGAALPWLVLHHAVNYAVGGTLVPANAVAAYLQWPGSPFTPATMTGGWKHASFAHLVLYSADLLVGKQGFLGHNLPLFLAVPALAVLCRRSRELPEVLFAGCWCGGTWLLYAINSVNHSGLCCAVRWFVPLLAPAYYGLALFLRDRSRWLPTFLVLSGWGAVLGVLMWGEGPWRKHMVPGFWAVQAAALVSCAVVWWRQRSDPRECRTQYSVLSTQYSVRSPEPRQRQAG
jgi:hypothetical protein